MNKFEIADAVQKKLHSRSGKHNLKEQCGDKAFLDPKNEKYPVVKPGDSSCNINCKQAHAAYVRARQWKAEDIAQKAVQLLKSKCPNMVPTSEG